MSSSNQTEHHRKWIRRVAIVFITIASFQALIAIFLLAISNTPQAIGTHLFSLGMAAITFTAALMMLHTSRVGGILLTGLPLIVLWFLVTKNPNYLEIYAVVLFTFAGLAIFALWHTQKYHSESLIDGTPIGGLSAIRWGGLTVLLLPIGAAASGYAIQEGNVSNAVLPAQEIPAEHYQWMAEQNFLLTNEKVQYFYSEGIFSISEGGNLLTDQYVGSWTDDDGGLESYWLPLGEVCTIETVSRGNTLEDAVYNLYGPGEDNWLQIWLSVEDQGHNAFLARLNYLNKRKQHPFVRAACDEGIEIDREALALENGIEPGIVTGEQVKAEHRNWLKNQSYFVDSETIIGFYSHGTYDLRPGGTMLTDEYIGGWYTNNGELASVWIKLGEICSIELSEAGNVDENEDAYYKINYGDDDWYKARLSTLGGLDTQLIEDAKQRNAELKTTDIEESCKTWGQPSEAPEG